jgi:PAS domain S-box-containing protein
MPSGQDETAVGRSARVWAHRPALPVLAVFYAAYVLTGGWSEGLALIPGVSIRFWPPAGLFVAALLLTRRPAWPWWVAAGCAAELTCNAVWFRNPLPMAVLYFGINAVEAVTAAVLIRLATPPPFRLDSPRQVVAFVGLGAAAAAVGATLFATAEHALGRYPFLTSWSLFWLGDATGLLVSTPLAVAAVRVWQQRTRLHPPRLVEAVVLAALLLVVTVLGLGGNLPTVYTALPLVLWAAVRFQLPGAATALALLVLTTAAYTAAGRGEFAGDPAERYARLVGLQTFLGVTAVSALVVAVLAHQHQRAVFGLRQANADLEARVAERTAEVHSERERLAVALRTGHLGAYEWDLRTQAVWWSPELYPLFGVDPAAFTPAAETFLALVHPDDRAEVWRKTEQSVAGGQEFVHEYRVVRPDGATRWVYNRSQVRRAGGQPTSVVGVVADVTERKEADEKVRASEERLRLFVENAPATLAMFDRDMRYLSVSRRWLTDYRLNADPTGRSHYELFRIPEQWKDGHRRALAGEVVRADEDRYVGPDGVEHWQRWEVRPWHDAHGGIGGVVIATEDVTARKRAEEALRASEAFARQVSDVAPAVLYVYDLVQRRNVWGNRGMFDQLGYTREQLDALGGNLLATLMHPDDLSRYAAHFDRLSALADGVAAEFDYRMKAADGGWRWLISRDMPFRRAADGRVTQIIGAALDVTARKQAEEALRDADRKKDEFLATLAHELRNPLAPIRAAVEVLRRPAAGGPEQDRARDIIDRQVRAMTRLIDDLMDVSRIRSGKIQLRRERVDLAAVVRNAVETSRPLIDDRGHTLTVELPPDPIPLDADPVRLAQALLNLLNNAAKYTERGGHIRLTVERAGDEAVVRVTDTGIGIAADKLPTLFEMFTQLTGETDRSQGGLGIGLALVKRLVEKHGGRITARSDGPGRGSEFTVTLPVAGAAPGLRNETPAPRAADAALPALPPGVKRVLVVDDNADAADSLALLLEMTGHTVRTAHDGEAAVAAAGEFRPHVVLCDIGLPKISGYEVCRRIRGQPWGRGLTLVAVTGRGMETDRRTALEAGFDHHLTKPVDPTAVVTLLAAPLPPA